MINNYNEAYKEYYDKVRGKSREKQREVDKLISTKDDIYPSKANVRNYNYRQGSYGVKSNKKNFKYIDRFIIRLILTFILFLGAFTLKVLPNEEAKEVYKVCKAAISKNFDFEKLIPSIEALGFNYSDFMDNIKEKYDEAINQISDINLDDINKASKL